MVFIEKLFKNVRAQYTVTKKLLRQKTKFQRMEVIETAEFGRMLVLDDIVETTERDEFIYHEMMTHVPLFTHPNPKHVLIIGGGDGGALREVLRHKSVEKAVMVEIDEAVVVASKKFLKKICANAFEDKRSQLIIGDGAAYVRDTKEKFDVVIVDSTDPLGPSMPLFGESFYKNVSRTLRKNGLVVRQTGSALLQPDELPLAVKHAKKVFQHVQPYVTAVPTYIGGFFTHPLMSHEDFSGRIRPAAVRKRFAQNPIGTKYYSPEVHAAAFALPEYIRKPLAK